jgi:7,8-dihydropterin-6-yl-methyl-4-(beta-D-ribofuranosyl)aminobenzene 5'-phosphate synthase
MLMTPALAEAFNREMGAARAAWAAGHADVTFRLLERAHILGQRHLWPHILTHLWMLRVGWRHRDWREVFGQLLRLAATLPAALFGWVPVGNTGGANVSALRPMPVPPEFGYLFRDTSKPRRTLVILLRIFLIVFLAITGAFLAMEWRRMALAKTIETQSSVSADLHITDLGSTQRLEIIPLVNWHAAAPELATEAGVAYLVRTDHATVLYDLGYNARREAHSPLKRNMEQLGISMDEIDAIFISHRHRDHVAGLAAERSGRLQVEGSLPNLQGKMIFTPENIIYPGSTPLIVDAPKRLFQGVATTGPIIRSLFMGPVKEQSLVVHVAGRGLVVIVGCGHQTVPALLDRLADAFAEPLFGMVGDFHYPVPEGRLRIAGLDAQRLFASGDGPFKPITMTQAQAELKMLDQLQLLALGGHDTSDEVIDWAADRFGDRFRRVNVGEPIIVKAP